MTISVKTTEGAIVVGASNSGDIYMDSYDSDLHLQCLHNLYLDEAIQLITALDILVTGIEETKARIEDEYDAVKGYD